MTAICEFNDDLVCVHCHIPTAMLGVRPCDGESAPQFSPLLGDRIESVLIGIGITKELWGSFTQRHGAPPVADCGGCDKRQQQLNDFDQYMRHVAADLGSAAKTAIESIWQIIPIHRKP